VYHCQLGRRTCLHESKGQLSNFSATEPAKCCGTSHIVGLNTGPGSYFYEI
jgi:hypothetical protein